MARGDEIIEMSTSTGKPRRMRRIGTLAFTLKGQPLTLTAFAEADDTALRRLFVPFGDLTSGMDTYQGGRYLDLDLKGSGVYELDFNRAYHPYCVFNPAVRVSRAAAREPSEGTDPRRRADALMADIRAIVFDFDGVLANSEPLHLLSYQAVLDELGIALGREEYYTHYLGFDDVTAFKVISERRGQRWSEAQIAAILERKTVVFDDIIAVDGLERRALPGGRVLRPAARRDHAARHRLGRAAP